MNTILFYNAHLSDNYHQQGGTQRMLIERAKEITSLYADCTIVVVGANITSTTAFSERILLAPLPLENERQEFINMFDTVVFYSEIEALEHVTKAHRQRWILDLHCWDIRSTERERIHDFDVVCTRSELHQKHIQQIINFAVPVHYVYNDLDFTVFKSPPHIQRKPLSLMYAGALVPHKGIDIALQALVLIKQVIPTVTFDVYGSATMWNHSLTYENELKKSAGELASFHGAVERHELINIFSQHSILLVPSPLESFSLISIEAQACGCIPIIHNSGGVAVTLDDRKTGFLYTPNTYIKLAETVITALPVVDAMRADAREFVSRKFNKADHSVRYADLLLQRGAYKEI